MPYTIKTQQIAVKDPDTGEYSGVDILTEQTTEGLLNEIKTLGNQKKNEITELGDRKKQAITNEGTAQVQVINSTGQEVLASIPNDYVELTKTVESLVRGSIIYDTTSGFTASFDDGVDGMLIKSLVANIDPVQDLHGYDFPWTGGSGKNKFYPNEIQTETPYEVYGVTYTLHADGTISTVGTSTASNHYRSIGKIILSAGDYIISGIPDAYNDSEKQSLRVRLNAYNGTLLGTSYTNNGYFRLSEENTVYVSVYTQQNTGEISHIIKPMIRPASETDATYEPYENYCPITGYTEVNVGRIDEFAARCNDEVRQENGLTITSTSDNYLDIDGIATSNNATGIVTFTATNNTLYISNLIVGDDTYSWFLWNATTSHNDSGSIKNLNGNYTLTIGNTYSIGFKPVKNKTYNHIKTRIMLSYSQPSNISVNWQDSAGTVYGATDDVINGKMKVNRAFIEFDADTNITFSNHGATGEGEYFKYWFGCYLTSIAATNNYDKWLFSHGICGTTGWSRVNRAYKGSSNRIYMLFGTNEDVTNTAGVTSFFAAQKTAGTPVQLVYTLASPNEYTLTPQQVTCLAGVNNIWADTGDVTVTYPVDTKTYIDKKIQEAIDELSGS